MRLVAKCSVGPCHVALVNNRRFGGSYRLHHQGGKNQGDMNNGSSKCASVTSYC
jgi:hypothetical protein